jgi:alpha-L-fucosidase 2
VKIAIALLLRDKNFLGGPLFFLASMKYYHRLLPALFALLLFDFSLANLTSRADESSSSSRDLTLWYTKPAIVPINEGLPIGGGRIGGLIMGGTANERIVLNEDSLWTGNENPSGGYDGKNFGNYQVLGNLLITLPGHDQNVSDYRRDLDLSQALAHVSYASNGVHYQREYFCSNPAQVMVVRMTADKPGSYTGTVALVDARKKPTQAQVDTLTLAASLPNDLKYEAQVTVLHDNGTVSADGDKISFQNCDAVTLIFAAGTDYAMDYSACPRDGQRCGGGEAILRGFESGPREGLSIAL